MKIGVLGTGMVGEAIATKLVSLGHEVRMGARSATNEKAAAWASRHGSGASHGTFSDAAGFGELIVNATSGSASLDALAAAGAANLEGKVLLDIANPLDFGKGMPPTLFTPGDDSLAERIQRAFPKAKVVKALNTVHCDIMVDPARVGGGEHHAFVSGDDPVAKEQVKGLLASFGWKHVLDLGPLHTARGTEQYLPLWLRLWGALGTADFNIRVVR